MKFCPVVPEICRGQVHGPRKERRKRIIIIIIIIIKNEAKTISLPNFEKLGYISIHGVLSSEFMNTNDFHIFYLGTGDLKLRNKIQLIAGNINNCVSIHNSIK
jgi:hypothetical protein